MKKLVLLSVCLSLVLVGDAQAVELVNPDGSRAEPYQSWAERAKVPTPAGRVSVAEDSHECLDPTVLGCTDTHSRILIERSACRRACRFVFLHELGHIFDTHMPEWKRRVFLRITRDGRAWDATTLWRDEPRERFADGYAMCAMGKRMSEVPLDRGEYGEALVLAHPLGPKQYRRVCRLVRQN